MRFSKVGRRSAHAMPEHFHVWAPSLVTPLEFRPAAHASARTTDPDQAYILGEKT